MLSDAPAKRCSNPFETIDADLGPKNMATINDLATNLIRAALRKDGLKFKIAGWN